VAESWRYAVGVPGEALPRLTLVVPAFNEEELLPRLLDSVDRAKNAFRHGPAAVETVVADNGSTDRTAEIAAARGSRVVRVETRAIAAARNGGARAARGDVLLFTDADGQIHERTFDAVEDALSDPRVVGGASGVTLERWSPGLAVTFGLFLPFLWLTGFDTGVVFCRRDDFERIGGYDEQRLFAEDVAFLVALRRHGRRTGRRLARLRGAKTIASTRKFDRHGDWHYLTAMPRVAWGALFRRESVGDWARRYWYDPDR